MPRRIARSGIHWPVETRAARVAIEIEESRIDTADLRVGMFVCRLDRPWEGTPFPLQGFELRTEEEIKALQAMSTYVFIDALRESTYSRDHLKSLARAEHHGVGYLTRSSWGLPEARFKRVRTYTDEASVEEELPRAREALQTASEMLDRIYADITSGRELTVDYVEMAVRPLVSSVLRSADAFLYLEGMRRHDSYSYGHAISCCALAALFGRHMGVHEDTIISLAAGGLLMDIGKTRVPEALLQYPGSLSANDIAAVRKHVEHGLDIVKSSGITDPDVMEVILTHHERNDGSGYPSGLMGAGIPIAGRMLGIIDTYDAMSSVRPYRPAVSRHHALQHIYAARDELFQAELVEQFQVCLGVYPTGSLVELNTGEVAVVMTQNQARRLRPRVLVLSTAAKQPLADFHTMDLLNTQAGQTPVVISRSLAVGEYGIDAAQFFLQ
jgi:HD-GYP domain-containing protein (c-di-GMP phosphodiesterase class II)